jgi:hypothetical protein
MLLKTKVLYRSIVDSLRRQTIYYGLKTLAVSESYTDSFALRVSLGMTSGILAACVAAPVDMARTRQQASSALKHEGVVSVLRVAYSEGGMRSLYRGSSAVLLRQAVFTGSQLATYDKAKLLVNKYTKLPVNSYETMTIASFVSGLVTAVAIAPIEVVKTRMQFAKTRLSLRDAFAATYAETGVRGFWRGSFAVFLKGAPHGSTSSCSARRPTNRSLSQWLYWY